MRKTLLTVFAAAMCVFVARADQGMWLPSLIGTRITNMQEKGFKLTAEDLYSINQASLKDAIVRFDKGCTAELISGEGLLLTNHHCGYGQIQQHSSVEHDYLTNGFWAMNKEQELPNPGTVVQFLVRMDDVTAEVTKGTAKLSGAKLEAQKKKNIDKIIANATKGTHYDADVEALYYGNQYFLFVYEVYKDVRLVAAPPSSIGKFGGDTDNWMWPRHTGDFSIFRIYADKDNKPAEYSPENVPYTPKKFFNISTQVLKEGDFTMVYGFPGHTYQYLASSAVDYTLNKSNPAKIHLRTLRLDVIKEASDKDAATRIAYASKTARIANAWKKWQGESLGLKRLGTIDKKSAYEKEFAAWAAGKPEYKGAVEELVKQEAEKADLALVFDYYNEAILGMEFAAFVNKIKAVNNKDKVLADAAAFYKDYSPAIDRKISKLLLNEYVTNVSKEFIPEKIATAISKHGSADKYIDFIFDKSIFVKEDAFGKAFEAAKDNAAFMESVKNDPALAFFGEFFHMNANKISAPLKAYTERINALYKTYVRGMMAFEKEKNSGRAFFPDANSTLRIAYGAVEGYAPEDGIVCVPMTTIDGIIAKDNPNIYDYDIPQKLRDIYDAKDYGRWAVDGTVPVCRLATNHTTGGNSGSPVLNANGELIGLNFDRTWLSTMSDIEFDPVMCRNIYLDIRYVLFTLDKVGGAGYLIDEMVVK